MRGSGVQTTWALPVRSDTYASAELVGYGHISSDSLISLRIHNIDKPIKNAYVYFGPQNVQNGSAMIAAPKGGAEWLQVSSHLR